MSKSNEFTIIAIDGGAATGKSSTSKGIADLLDLMHVDTGSHYRTLTHALLGAAASADSEADIASTLEALKLSTQIDGRSARLGIDGIVPADTDLRSARVNANVSKFAAVAAVRQKLFDYQRSLAEVSRENGYTGLIMEGRDIGSIIFPDADHRIFLHADEATRTARRAKEGQTDSIAARDKMDSSRKTAPLVCPDGATQVDTGPLTLEEVIAKIADVIRS